MILVGQYDSPFVRRVAVSLRALGLVYEHDTRSVFADFEAMRAVNPLGRIPSLVLDDGETLIGPPPFCWPGWVERCRTQAAGAIEALATEPWAADARLDQAQITTACMIRYVQMADPDLIPPGRYPALDGLSVRCEARPEFRATYPAEYAVPRQE
jgi:glutathione S-transferase